MNQNFLSSNNLNVLFPDKVVSPVPPNREPLKHLLIGSPKGVTSTIHTLHHVGYAEVGLWSPLVPYSNSGQVMSILIRYILL